MFRLNLKYVFNTKVAFTEFSEFHTNLYEEVKDALDDLINLNYEEEDEIEKLRLILLKLIKRITVDEQGNVKMITTFGLKMSDIK